ncbi:MAG TPA: DUF4339 domain-containing protein [Chthoniobacteraceae bacterium]|jgi:hypothetical protein
MEIYILHAGTQLGPFTEEVVQTLLRQGNVSIADPAWSPGMPEWIPLANLLYATPGAAADEGESSEPPPAPDAEPEETTGAAPSLMPHRGETATARQKAFLTYMGVSFPPELTKESASLLVNDQMENPKDPARISSWNVDRLRLHPELFATEIQTRKENRSRHFLEICENEGADYFAKITKAHCQVLVSYLDVKFPNWDTHEDRAAWDYFFPAVAEKFPQLLTKEGKGRFHYPEPSKAASHSGRRATVPIQPRRSSVKMPVLAVVKGLFFGGLIVGMLWFGKQVLSGKSTLGKNADKPPSSTPAASSTSSNPDEPVTGDPASVPATSGTPAVAGATLPAETPVGSSPDLAGSPTASSPSSPSALLTPDPPSTGTTAASTFPTATPAPPDATPAARTVLRLTKPFEIPSAYGKVKLPPGTTVKLLQQTGTMLKVTYLNNTFTIPVTSTDLIADAPMPGTPPPAAPATIPTPLPDLPPLGTPESTPAPPTSVPTLPDI